MNGGITRELGADTIEQGRGRHEFIIGVTAQRAFLESSRINADAQRLGENELIAILRIGVTANISFLADTDDGKTIDRFGRVDGMATSDWNARGLTNRRAAFQNFAHHLGPDYPFYGLQSQGLDGKQPYLTCIEDMAAHYVEEIRAAQPEGPYYLGGYCMGGTVAYEIARRLREDGQQVHLLALLDTYNYHRSRQHSSLGQRLSYWRQKIVFHWMNVARLHGRDRLTYFGEKFWTEAKQVAARLRVKVSGIFRAVHRQNGQQLVKGFLEDINDHFILCGYGRIGGIIANELHQQGVQS